MKKSDQVLFVFIGPVILISGCSVPAQWAKDLPYELRCGMSVDEVRQISGKRLVPLDGDPRWSHLMGDEIERTQALVDFRDGGLRSLKVIWQEPIVGMGLGKTGPRIEMCPK